MTTESRLNFRQTLKAALDDFHPDWDVRRHVGPWDSRYHERWEENRQLGVWVDTLRRWVEGENFPRVKKFEGFLDATEFPADVRENLHRLFHSARSKPKATLITSDTENDDVRVIGTPIVSPLKPFVGRSAIIDRLNGWLVEGQSMVTLVGRSGIGKSALACHVLHEQSKTGDILDAVVYSRAHTDTSLLEQIVLNCAELGDADLLKTTWASPASLSRKVDALIEQLSGLSVAVLVDEVEVALDKQGQFLEDGIIALIEAAVRPGSPLRLLFTSQIEISLPSGLRHLSQLIPLDRGLSVGEGIHLLRTLDANGACGLHDAEESQLRALVENVHGSPRALEVIVGILTNDRLARIEDIIQQFESFEDIQTMLAEGYRRLDAEATAVLEALAVLRHPVKPIAMAALLNKEPDTILPSLQHLVRARLVEANRTTGTVQLPAMEADFAYRRLANEQRQILENKAIDYYQAQRRAPEECTTIEDLVPHIRTFEHLVRANQIGKAAQLVLDVTLRERFMRMGYVQQIITMHQQLMPLLHDADEQAHNSFALGEVFRLVGQFEDAALCFEQTIDAARMAHNEILASRGLIGLGHLNRYLGRYEAAIEAYEQALELEDYQTLAIGLTAELGIGMSHHYLGESERALIHIETVYDGAQHAKLPMMEGKALQMMGEVLQALGEIDSARERLHQGLKIAQQIENQRNEITIYTVLGMLHEELGQLDRALKEERHALQLSEQVSSLQTRAEALVRLGTVLGTRGDIEGAYQHINTGLALADRIGARTTEADAWYQLLVLDLTTERHDMAGLAAHNLYQIAGATRNRIAWEAWHSVIAAYYLQTDQLPLAHTMIMRALAFPMIRSHHHALALEGIIKFREGDHDGARIAFTNAYTASQSPKIATLYRAHYTHGLACVGLAMTDKEQMIAWLEEAQNAYLEARWRCESDGAILQGRYWLGLLQATLPETQTLIHDART